MLKINARSSELQLMAKVKKINKLVHDDSAIFPQKLATKGRFDRRTVYRRLYQYLRLAKLKIEW